MDNKIQNCNLQIVRLIAFTCVCSLLFIVSHEAFADNFMDFPIRLKHSPTFCALEPQPNSQMPTLSKVLADVTNNAVSDWQTKLNEGNGRHPVWNMTLIHIPLSEQSGFDYSKCDVTINYLPKPNTTNSGFVATGITIPNFDTGKTRIEIYYTMLEVGSKMITWTQGNNMYYAYERVPVYLDGAIETEPQLEGIVRHEIGHSLGLGHYLISSEERGRIVNGLQDMPSIMIDTTTTFGVTHYSITPLDVAEIKSIYGMNGFDGGIPSTNFQKINVISTDKTNYGIGDPVGIKIDTKYFTDNTRGSLMIVDPDGMLFGMATVTQTNSTFELKNDKKIGKYDVEFVDYGYDIYDYSAFELSANNTSQLVNEQSNSQTTSLPGIPSWVKNNAHYWSTGDIGDGDFVQGLQYLIQNKIIQVPPTQVNSTSSQPIPSWVKNTANLWSSGQLTDNDFIKALQYLISSGIISVS